MLQECLMGDYRRKFSMENVRKENAPKVAKQKHYKDILKAAMTDFNIPTASWEQGAQD